MKLLMLWGSNNFPTDKRWVPYEPLAAAYVDDKFLPDFIEKCRHPYYNKGIRAKLAFVVIEASFFSMTYINRKEGSRYELCCLVRTKDSKYLDYKLEFFTDRVAYELALAECSAHVDVTDVLQLSRWTTDPTVELFYYPKEVIDVIENF